MTKPTTNPIKAGLQRLRESRDAMFVRHYDEGHAAGRRWALNRATYEALFDVAMLLGEGFATPVVDRFFQAYLGDRDAGRSAMQDASVEVFGRPSPAVAQLDGFIVAASEVCEEVDADA